MACATLQSSRECPLLLCSSGDESAKHGTLDGPLQGSLSVPESISDDRKCLLLVREQMVNWQLGGARGLYSAPCLYWQHG